MYAFDPILYNKNTDWERIHTNSKASFYSDHICRCRPIYKRLTGISFHIKTTKSLKQKYIVVVHFIVEASPLSTIIALCFCSTLLQREGKHVQLYSVLFPGMRYQTVPSLLYKPHLPTAYPSHQLWVHLPVNPA